MNRCFVYGVSSLRRDVDCVTVRLCGIVWLVAGKASLCCVDKMKYLHIIYKLVYLLTYALASVLQRAPF